VIWIWLKNSRSTLSIKVKQSASIRNNVSGILISNLNLPLIKFATVIKGNTMKNVLCVKLCLLVISVLATLVGCNESAPKKSVEPSKTAVVASPASEESHKLIVRYNQLLSEGYKTTNMTKLQEVATPELAEKAYYHMAAIGEGKSRMVSELKKIDFVETDCAKPAACRVVTKERWDFAYSDILTGQRSNEVKDYIYDVQYVLENRQGRWIIMEITAAGEERKELPSWGKMFKKQ
jgi:hypothetical protein